MILGGLAIAIGMLVDAAVVVVENIVQRLAYDPTAGKLPRLHTIYRAVREVAVPVTRHQIQLYPTDRNACRRDDHRRARRYRDQEIRSRSR